MPRNALADAKKRLIQAFALLDARIDDLKGSDADADHALQSRLAIARECVRHAIESVEHAEEVVTGGTADECSGNGQD